eukprot:CAMPEP_0206142044 /NCGR_PEP_ID=MMETSP1473-20131121/15216_1 /ASSEMBLY_ACC=CAM_ASM_001109 /TAXON_ID=1461547 /ORGANISM="Stichococcus sp, Strain RCC1054" /LENGTH=161 /DNA_ID=CAMNT_0053536859 /DNA_START=119 /DNA_END=604 /DNA_ORIENTATION=-
MTTFAPVAPVSVIRCSGPKHAPPTIRQRLPAGMAGRCASQVLCRQHVSRVAMPSGRQPQHICAAGTGDEPDKEDEENEENLLTEEEDWEVPGSIVDARNPRSKLGKAIKEAAEEMNHFGDLERENLQQAQALLEKLGYKGNIMKTDGDDEDAHEEEADAEE